MVGFVILAILAFGSAVGVVAARQPVHSALFLVGNILSLAVLYLTLSAEFMAVAQVIVYAGAIMVLFLFVVTLLTAGKNERESAEGLPGQRLWAGLLSVAVGGTLAVVILRNPVAPGAGTVPGFGSIRLMGVTLWGPDFPYLAAVALMLLTAGLGVLVLNRSERAMPRRQATAKKKEEPNAH